MRQRRFAASRSRRRSTPHRPSRSSRPWPGRLPRPGSLKLREHDMNVHVPARDVCSDGSDLIEIDEACIRAARHALPITAVETVAICQAGGRTLAENIGATLALPAFDQSAMDGYAVALGGEMLPAATRVQIVGRVAAGDTALFSCGGPSRPHLHRRSTASWRRCRPDAGARLARRQRSRAPPDAQAGRQHSAFAARTSRRAITCSRQAPASTRVTSLCSPRKGGLR